MHIFLALAFFAMLFDSGPRYRRSNAEITRDALVAFFSLFVIFGLLGGMIVAAVTWSLQAFFVWGAVIGTAAGAIGAGGGLWDDLSLPKRPERRLELTSI